MKFIVYVAILLVAAAGLALGLDLLTTPPKKLEANNAKPATEAVRQIPIKRAEAQDKGDPNQQLTPVYPATPGKNLPIKDTPVKAAAQVAPPAQAAAPAPVVAPVQVAAPAAKPVETTGNAPAPQAAAAAPVATANAAPAAPATPVAAAAPMNATTAAAPNSCNVQACASAYRSFRASDCSYQPFEGPRKFCDATDAGPGLAAASPPAAAPAAPRAQSRDAEALQEAARAVRSLPRPGARYRDEREIDDRDVVVEEPLYGERTGLRRQWIIEQR